MPAPMRRQTVRRPPAAREREANNTAILRPTDAQRRYLQRGLTEPGGKLPLFDRDGREVPRRIIETCLAHGWAERWTTNPIQPDWLVCRLTLAGRRALESAPGKRS